MSFDICIVMSFFMGVVIMMVVCGIKELIEKCCNRRRRMRDRISQLEAVCEKQKNQLIFYRNEAEING